MMCLSVGFFIFIFILVQVLYISWVSISTFLLRCGKASATVSLNSILPPFFLYFLDPQSTKHMLFCLSVNPPDSPPFFFCFFFLCSSASIVFVSSCLQIHWFYLLPGHICSWGPPVKFLICFFFCLALVHFCLFDIPILFMHHFPDFV